MSHLNSHSSDDTSPLGIVQQLIEGGQPLATGLRAYAEDCPSRLSSSLSRLADGIESGLPIEQALQQPGIEFPPYVTGIFRGNLPSSRLGILLEQYLYQSQSQRRFRRRIALEFAYPILILILSGGLGLAILVWLIPMFRSMFDSFGIEMPGITRMLILMSSAAEFLFWPLTGSLIAATVLLVLFVLNGRWTVAVLDRLPIIGQAVRYSAMSEFCALLAPLVESGIPTGRALTMVASAMQPSRVRSGTAQLGKAFDGSRELAVLAESRRLLPSELIHLLKWEHRGVAFAEILRSWAELFSRMSHGHSTRIIAILTPLAMLFIGGIVLLTVVALFTPLIRMTNSLS